MLNVRVKYNRVFKFNGVTYFGCETLSMQESEFNSGMLDMIDVMGSEKRAKKVVGPVVVDEELGESPVTDDSVSHAERAKAGSEKLEEENAVEEKEESGEQPEEEQESDELPEKKKVKKSKKNKR